MSEVDLGTICVCGLSPTSNPSFHRTERLHNTYLSSSEPKPLDLGNSASADSVGPDRESGSLAVDGSDPSEPSGSDPD
ncbi:hypothetical protein M407DRAFT_21063 [Tulasnella calospora MUT 4182]|uniref:Uncharacterized protein n=1 Tax=Tulasnella calospora MUT 4182 TaxID=1051891 RepID=A0A0C3M807_9AGAM|nr:hypothetical protein M407DRAFT_21063 [Tulasnella calospora MUT 4182]